MVSLKNFTKQEQQTRQLANYNNVHKMVEWEDA